MSICELFESNNGPLRIAAPMVRYSKLPFRKLVRRYSTDIAFTPMILAESFAQSEIARKNEFSTDDSDRPLIVQFAASSSRDFVAAATIVAPYCDGVDLNCGCPQGWAIKSGIGAALLSQPQFIADVVSQTRNAIPLSVSIKIRLDKDIRKTVELCRQAEAAGVSFITVHGRTRFERSEPIHLDDIKVIRESIHVPLIVNGDVKNSTELMEVAKYTGAKGVMVARGLLSNPSLFEGTKETPLSVIQDWVNISLESKNSFKLFHHHLSYMLERIMSRHEKKIFNSLLSTPSVLDYLGTHYNIYPQL